MMSWSSSWVLKTAFAAGRWELDEAMLIEACAGSAGCSLAGSILLEGGQWQSL
jgi:hypothetical protein